ncbi:hypothetical protein AAAC51_07380 [Priestia megaterium]
MTELKKITHKVKEVLNIGLFKDVKNVRDLMHVNIEIPEEIPDMMPKYATSMFERLKKIKSGDPSLVDHFIEADSLGTMKEIQLKNAYNQAGMYAFISWQWVTPFIEWLNGRKVLEVMAGRGWWTYALRQKVLMSLLQMTSLGIIVVGWIL